MTGLFTAFAVIAGLIVALYALGLSGMATVRARWAGLAISAAALGAVYLAGVDMLGRAKPMRLTALEADMPEARLVASHAVEGAAIYLWLMPGTDSADGAPRAYVLPWSQEMAEALRAAKAEAEANGTAVIVSDPFNSAIAPGERFTTPPPPALPPKRAG